MRKCSGKILAAVLTGFALASAVSAGTLAAQEGNRPAMGDVRRIQAYTDETVYGTGLVKVEVTYNNGVSLTGINADSYILEDRGTLSPDYGKVKIAKAVVDGQVVTLTMDKGTAATENNDQIKRIICKQFSDHCFIRLLQIIVVMPETPGGAILPRQFIQIINSQGRK